MEHLLFEHIGGFELFELKEFEKIADASFNDYLALSQVVNHISSLPMTDTEEANAEFKNLQDGILSDSLKNFLQINNVKILHCDKSLRNPLQDIGIVQKSSPNIYRGIKFNLRKFLKQPTNKQLILSVSHIVAKEAIKYNLEREDNMAISTGYEVEHLEQEINFLNEKLFKLLNFYFPMIKDDLKEDTFTLIHVLNNEFDKLEEKSIPEHYLQEIKNSLDEMTGEDKEMIRNSLKVIQEKKELLESLDNYLAQKMKILAPNLREILGDHLSFKMIHKAGGLINLSLYPSSTLQLLGAEKSLFRSLKMRRNTPKYGMIYNLISLKENQGKICRSIAAKCSLAARIDCFNESRTNEFGKELKNLIDKKIKSQKSGNSVEKSSDVLKRVYKRIEKISKNQSDLTNNQKKFKINAKSE